MYAVDEHDVLVAITDIPRPDTGAAIPMVLVNEQTAVLAFYTSDVPEELKNDKTIFRPIRDFEDSICIVKFNSCDVSIFPPFNHDNDEMHPLKDRGFYANNRYEVLNSSWIRSLQHYYEPFYRIHKATDKEFNQDYFGWRRHFILGFLDSTFECIAKDYEVKLIIGSMKTAASQMFDILYPPKET